MGFQLPLHGAREQKEGRWEVPVFDQKNQNLENAQEAAARANERELEAHILGK